MEIYARQGDLVIERLREPLDEESLVQQDSPVLSGISSGHRHHIVGPALVSVTGRVTRLRISRPTQLVHESVDGHFTVELTPGDYEIRPLRERGDVVDRAVED